MRHVARGELRPNQPLIKGRERKRSAGNLKPIAARLVEASPEARRAFDRILQQNLPARGKYRSSQGVCVSVYGRREDLSALHSGGTTLGQGFHFRQLGHRGVSGIRS